MSSPPATRPAAPGAPIARWPAVLALLALSGVLAGTLWLRIQLGRVVDDTRGQVVRLFDDDLLGRPGEEDIAYAPIIQAADRARSHPLVRNVVVYRLRGARGVDEAGFELVYPYWGAPVDPLAARRSRPAGTFIRSGSMPLGIVDVEMDGTIIVAANVAVASALLLTLVSLGALVRRLRRHEIKLRSTTIELEEKRRQLIATERLALAGRLSASLLHDLRKPVQAIRAMAQMNVPTLAAPEAQGGVDEGWKSVVEQTDTFQGILQSTRLERFARGGGAATAEAAVEWCDLRDLVERSLNLVQYERGDVEVELVFAEAVLLIEANPYELLQTISNIVLNAFQAMHGRGRLRVVTARIAGSGGGAQAELRFEDDGPGVPEGQREAIFEPFRTTRGDEGGSGLGMYIAREIVRGLGGELTVETAATGGAAFTIRLPLAPEDAS